MPTRKLPLLVALCLVTLGLTSCGGGGGTTPPPPKLLPYVFITYLTSNDGTGYIDSFLASSTGEATPSSQVTAATGYTFRDIRGDGTGNIYVMTAPDTNTADVTVQEYSADSGVLTLKRSFTSLLASTSEALAADRSGTVYVSEGNGSVAVFASSASGNATPTVPISFPDVIDAMTTDASGNVYVLEAGKGLLYEYPSAFAGNATQTLNPGTYINDFLTDVAVDSTGAIYVSGTNQSIGEIIIYDIGSPVPTRTISGSNTTLHFPPSALAIDADNNLHVNNDSYSYLTFASGANGNVAPTSTFTVAGVNYDNLYAGLAVY